MRAVDGASARPEAAEPGPVDPASRVPVAGRGARWRPWLIAVAPLIGVLGFLGTWQLLVVVFDVERFVLPAPWDILVHVADDPGFYWRNARTTAWEAMLGFAIAAVVGVMIGAVMALSTFAERAIMPVAVLVQVTPIIAYAPAIVIWLDFGLRPILTVTALVCVVPFIFNAVAGLRSVDPALLELAESVDAGRWTVFRRLRLPASVPYLFSAARIAVGLALIGAVLGEFFAGVQSGLGYSVKVAQSRFLVDQLWGSIFVLAALGGVATLALSVVERSVLRGRGLGQP